MTRRVHLPSRDGRMIVADHDGVRAIRSDPSGEFPYLLCDGIDRARMGLAHEALEQASRERGIPFRVDTVNGSTSI